MDIKTAIEKRRSIRKYQVKEIPDSLIRELVEAARLAPSAYNAQPSRFVILKSKSIKEKLKKEGVFKQPFVYEAPVIIVCSADPEVYPKEKLEPPYSRPREIAGEVGAVRDLSISTQNLVLRATDLGLGTCYVGLVKRDEIKEILGIPKNYVLPFVVTLGYPAEETVFKPRKNLDELIIKSL